MFYVASSCAANKYAACPSRVYPVRISDFPSHTTVTRLRQFGHFSSISIRSFGNLEMSNARLAHLGHRILFFPVIISASPPSDGFSIINEHGQKVFSWQVKEKLRKIKQCRCRVPRLRLWQESFSCSACGRSDSSEYCESYRPAMSAL
jgi:hypothetical protein